MQRSSLSSPSRPTHLDASTEGPFQHHHLHPSLQCFPCCVSSRSSTASTYHNFFWLADPQQLAAIACIIFDDGHWMIAGGMEESKAATHCCMLTGEPWSREKGTDFLAHSLPHMQLEGREQLTLWLRGSCLRRHTPLTFVKH